MREGRKSKFNGVLLPASGSERLLHVLSARGQDRGALLTACYGIRETLRIGRTAAVTWEAEIQSVLQLVSDALAMGERALVFPKAKDRPVVITALAAEAAVLITLDRTDFHGALGREIYGMRIRTPADFLIELRKAGQI